MTDFFRVVPTESSGWYVSNIQKDARLVDVREFTEGRIFSELQGSQRLLADIERSGKQLEWTFSDFDSVILSSALSDEIMDIEGSENIQLLPLDIVGASGSYCIANTLNNVNCFNYHRSTYTAWGEADGRADKVGELRMVLKLVIDPERAAGRHVFRVSEWPVALIVSDHARDVIQRHADTGIAFWPVTQ